MTELLELLDKLNEMAFESIEVEEGDLRVSIKRTIKVTKVARQASPSIEELGGFTSASQVKEPGMASHGQVKYARDLLFKSFADDETQIMDFLAHTLEVPIQEVNHPDTWDDTMTREMATMILNPLEKMNGINKQSRR